MYSGGTGYPYSNYWWMGVTSVGTTYMRTVNAAGTNADFDIEADGELILTSASSENVTLNPGSDIVKIEGTSIVFEGATPDAYETTLTVTEPSGSDKTITFPNATGTVALTSDIAVTTLSGTTANGIATYGGANQIDIESSLTYDSNTLSHNGNFTIDVGNELTIDVDSGILNIKDAGVQKVKLGNGGLDFTDNTAAEITFEGSTDNAYKTIINVTDPTNHRTCTFPDDSGIVALGTETTADGKTFVLKTAKVTITQAQFNSLHTTPIDLIAAPGASKQIVPVSATFPVDRLTTQANASADLNIHYDLGGSVGSYFTNSYMHIRRFMWNEGGDVTYNIASASAKIATSKTVFQNKKLQISVDSILQDSGGTQNCIGDSDIYISYYILDMS